MFHFKGYDLVPEALEAALTARLALYGRYGLIVDGEFRGANDQSYRCPTSEQLMDFVMGRRDLLERKANHGFTDVEMGLDVSGEQQIRALCTAITTHADVLTSLWGLSLRVDTGTPVYDYWYDDPHLPLFYRRGSDWVTKVEFYGLQPFPGVHIAFVRPVDDEMPRKGQGWGNIGGRPNLAGGISPLEQYDLFGNGAYKHESAFTIDLAIARTLRSIEERQVVPHVCTRTQGTVAWCSRNRFGAEHGNPALVRVPYLCWNVNNWRLNLLKYYADARNEHYAPPAAVGLEA